ncbi:protein-L-isoaspartate O-methyltransferase [Variovorax sp. M-6]|uniref:protein-L-isoaspartate O-methyltransferase family protein n=1 Tax=Variovorax sp. M-6 TaxID=3233041 RepID=UPI003F94F47F
MTDPVTTLQQHRDFYARLVVGLGGSSNKRLVAAFASVERERFLGCGPWHVLAGDAYIQTATSDPRWLYQDILIGIAQDRGINNGQPSLHARCLAACAPKQGESVLHIGAGSGYYSAILAELVGPEGRVTAYEVEPDLAEFARINLAPFGRVVVETRDATKGSLPCADVIYVNAGATHPVGSWLDALAVDGRLVFPMTTETGAGFMLMICRWREDAYTAACLSLARFIPCVGARSVEASRTLSKALAARPPQVVRSFHRGVQPDGTAWCVGEGWWLSTADPTA